MRNSDWKNSGRLFALALTLSVGLAFSLQGWAQDEAESRTPQDSPCVALYQKSIRDGLSARNSFQDILAVRALRDHFLTGRQSPLVFASPSLGRSLMGVDTDPPARVRRLQAALRLRSSDSGEFRILVSTLQRRHPQATDSEIHQILDQGFMRGDFCEDGQLRNSTQIRRYISARL